MVAFYARHLGFDFVVLRYANVYGPRQNSRGEAGVVAIFGRLMKKRLPYHFRRWHQGQGLCLCARCHLANHSRSKKEKMRF